MGARQYQNQQQQIRDRQRQILRDENLSLMAQKKNKEEFDRSLDIAKTGTSPGYIGDGHAQ